MHVQVVPGSSFDSPVVTPRHNKNLIESLVVKYPYHRGYWKFQKDGIGQLLIFLKVKTLFSLEITIF